MRVFILKADENVPIPAGRLADGNGLGDHHVFQLLQGVIVDDHGGRGAQLVMLRGGLVVLADRLADLGVGGQLLIVRLNLLILLPQFQQRVGVISRALPAADRAASTRFSSAPKRFSSSRS